MAIEGGSVAPLFATPSVRSASTTIDLGAPRLFVAWLTLNMIDPLDAFDRDNAIAADIFTIDGNRTATRVFDGDHFGPLGTGSNVFQGATFGFGQRIGFFLRVVGPGVAVAAEAVVVF
jgi:hypothetical protein